MRHHRSKNCPLHNCQREGWSCRSARTTTEQFDFVLGCDCCLWGSTTSSCAKKLDEGQAQSRRRSATRASGKFTGPDDLQGDAEGSRLPLATGDCEVINTLGELLKRFKLWCVVNFVDLSEALAVQDYLVAIGVKQANSNVFVGPCIDEVFEDADIRWVGCLNLEE